MNTWITPIASTFKINARTIIEDPSGVAVQLRTVGLANLKRRVAERPAHILHIDTYICESVHDLEHNEHTIVMEATCLDLLTPNQFPPMVLFRRLSRLTTWLHRPCSPPRHPKEPNT